MFVLIPDMYARNDILKEEYGFDNSDFLGALRQRIILLPMKPILM